MLSFNEWAHDVDMIICRAQNTEANQITAPYAEMWLRDYSAQRAAWEAMQEATKDD